MLLQDKIQRGEIARNQRRPGVVKPREDPATFLPERVGKSLPILGQSRPEKRTKKQADT
jgi:hypothetical protein